MWYNLELEGRESMAKRKRLNYRRVALVGVLAIAVVGSVIGIFVLRGKRNEEKKPPESNPPVVKNTIEDLYYYDLARKDRYEAYQKLHPEMSEEEVVWRVDADIDIEGYTEMKSISSEDADNEVLLVNKHFRLSDDYEPAELEELYNGLYLTPNALVAFEKMVSAASLEDLDVVAGSTYRSVDFQRGLYQSYVEQDGQEEADTYSARAGSSEHHTGRAIDLVGPDWTLESFEGTPECDWIHQNAYKYGFILRYQKEYEDVTGYIYEPWHITYIGVEAATKMHDEKIDTLEEYYVKYVMYQPQL